ncbi:hypothetical protein Taro_038351 [Colocasia esculenta]|uniref:anthranilate synthase n=1 Tax=Colocasia esculenta TaxID=4460 RepID=A0A843W7Z3_COLES|nr:hypothetical protein [Colocasia esculenta]
MAASLLPLHTPAAAAALRGSSSSPGIPLRPRLLYRNCSADRGCWKGSLEVRRCSAVVSRASAVEVPGLEVGDTRVCNGSASPIIVIDNYDSFTYNLCQYMGELGANFEVYRNDELSIEEMKRKKPRGILISPGPGTPQDSGISLQTVIELGPSIPLFGVCMGLQCIGEAFGGKIVRTPHGVMHGKSSLVYYDEKGKDVGRGLSSSPLTFHEILADESRTTNLLFLEQSSSEATLNNLQVLCPSGIFIKVHPNGPMVSTENKQKEAFFPGGGPKKGFEVDHPVGSKVNPLDFQRVELAPRGPVQTR